MKLKGKLITSFASVVVGTLLVFGAITYYTFAESTWHNAEQIIKLNHLRIILEVKGAFSDKLNNLYHLILPQIPEILEGSPQNIEERAQILLLASHEPALQNVMLYNFQNMELISLISRDIESSILPSLKEISPSGSVQIIVSGDNFWLLGPVNGKTRHTSLLVQIDKEDFYQFVKSYLNINRSVLYITEHEKLLIPPVFHDLDLKTTVLDYTALPAFTPGVHHIDMGDAGQVYRLPETVFGVELTYLIPNNFFTHNIIALKNRLLTAMLIVCWCSLWVILILAHKIATPIKELTQSTKDIIAFNYSNALKVGKGEDEISELSANFETMRKKLKDLVTKDQLTHVYNRRFLLHLFELAVLKAVRLHEDLCCIMIDIDFFKKVNDTYGHQAGDYVLVEMGKVLKEYTRDYDSPARYGGEEFILVLPETSAETALSVAERIRKAMEKRVMVYEEQEIRCTLSMGIAALDIHNLNTTDKLILYADKALYEAKESGRNKSVLSKGAV